MENQGDFNAIRTFNCDGCSNQVNGTKCISEYKELGYLCDDCWNSTWVSLKKSMYSYFYGSKDNTKQEESTTQ